MAQVKKKCENRLIEKWSRQFVYAQEKGNKRSKEQRWMERERWSVGTKYTKYTQANERERQIPWNISRFRQKKTIAV